MNHAIVKFIRVEELGGKPGCSGSGADCRYLRENADIVGIDIGIGIIGIDVVGIGIIDIDVVDVGKEVGKADAGKLGSPASPGGGPAEEERG